MSPIPHYNPQPQPQPEPGPAGSPPPVPAEPPRRSHRTALWLIAAVVAVVVAGTVLWWQRTPQLKKDDPSGYAACEQLVISRDSGQSTRTRVGALLQAGTYAHDASTPAIRDAVDPIKGLGAVQVANVKRLEVACEDAGVDIPNAQ